MKKSIIIMTLLSFVLVLTLSVAGCKKGSDHPTNADNKEHPTGDKEHPTGGK